MKPASKSQPSECSLTNQQRRQSLVSSHCVACEGGVAVLPMAIAQQYLSSLQNWELDETGRLLSRRVIGGSFVKVIDLVNRIATLAEEQQHHPDLHVTGYRHLQIVLTTHAIGGLSENDFIIAAKIDNMLTE